MLGEMLIAEKKYSEAKKIVLPVTTDANYAGRATLLMSQIADREGDASEAVTYRTKAIKVLTLQKDYYRVGELYMLSGNRAEALKNYSRAADKDDVMAMIKAADLYYLAGKSDRAKAYYKKALDKGINEPKSAQWADYQYGKITHSEAYLDKAKVGGGLVGQAADAMKSAR
jgi:tetratricopeptide (TPR) repeat protein